MCETCVLPFHCVKKSPNKFRRPHEPCRTCSHSDRWLRPTIWCRHPSCPKHTNARWAHISHRWCSMCAVAMEWHWQNTDWCWYHICAVPRDRCQPPCSHQSDGTTDNEREHNPKEAYFNAKLARYAYSIVTTHRHHFMGLLHGRLGYIEQFDRTIARCRC